MHILTATTCLENSEIKLTPKDPVSFLNLFIQSCRGSLENWKIKPTTETGLMISYHGVGCLQLYSLPLMDGT